MVWYSATNGFTPGSGNVLDCGNTAIASITNLIKNTQYYFRVGAYDIFGKSTAGTGMNLSSQLSFTTPSNIGIPSGSVLPSSGMLDGDTFFNTSNGTLYTYSAALSAWVQAGLSYGPSLPVSGTTNQLFYDTTTSVLDQWNGTSWQPAVDGTSIVAGSITASQIAAGTITTGLLSAGSVTTSILAAGAVTAAKIAVLQLPQLKLRRVLSLLRTLQRARSQQLRLQRIQFKPVTSLLTQLLQRVSLQVQSPQLKSLLRRLQQLGISLLRPFKVVPSLVVDHHSIEFDHQHVVSNDPQCLHVDRWFDIEQLWHERHQLVCDWHFTLHQHSRLYGYRCW